MKLFPKDLTLKVLLEEGNDEIKILLKSQSSIKNFMKALLSFC